MTASSNSLPPGTILGPYEVVEPLGAGGMGEVYRAVDPRLEREVAVKVLPESLAADPDLLRRFRDEALTASRLNHPNIVHIYDIGEQTRDDGVAVRYVAMELVDGQTFGALLKDGPLPWDRLRPLVIQVLEGLVKAHGAGVVHRDLKTENLMLTADGHVKILDFGLAKRLALDEELSSQGTRVGTPTQPGMALGTLGYMAPEQAKGIPADHRADQFSFGVVLYEMATGERPFARETPAESFAAMITTEPKPLEQRSTDLPAIVCELVMRCLSKSPEERFPTTAELLEAFESATSEPGSGLQRTALEEPVADHRTPLAGRDDELGQLVSRLDRAVAGKGALVTLVGEPGVGKTRLTQEIERRARDQGCVTLVGHCYEGEGAPPYSPWVEILERTGQISDRDTLRELLGEGGAEVAKIYPELRQLVPDLPPALELPPEQQRPYLFRCFKEFVERCARRQPVLLILEDLHWADDATLLLLEHLAAPLKEVPLLVVGTYRDVDLEVSRPLAKTLRQLVRERLVEKINLSRLDIEGVTRMLEGLSGQTVPSALAAKIHDETEGNPFFVEEVYLHLEEEGRLFDETGEWRTDLSLEDLDVPEGVRLVVGRRLERLSDEERKVLTAASVIGRRFTYELLEKVSTADPDRLLDAVEHAEKLKLIEPAASKGRRSSGYRFSHELIRQTLVGDLSLPRRQRLHLRIAEGIEDTAADPTQQASVLAHHLYQAGAAADEEKTLRFLTLAGEQALDSGAFEEALRHFDDALSLLDEASPEEQAEVLRLRGQACLSLGRFQEALEDWQKVMPVLEKREQWETLAEIAQESVEKLAWQGRAAEGAAIAGKVLDLLPDESTRQRARLLAALGMHVAFAGDYEAGRKNLVDAESMAKETGDVKVLGEVLKLRLFLAWVFLERKECFEVGQRAIELLEAANDEWSRVEVEGFRLFAATQIGRLDEVPESRLSEAESMAERLGQHGARAHFSLVRANRDWMTTGDLEKWDQHKNVAVEIFTAIDNAFLAGHKRAASMSTFWRGNWEAARDSAGSGANTLEGTSWDGGFRGYVFLFECYLGNDETARGELAKHEHLLPPAEAEHPGVGPCLLLLMVVEGLSVLGRKEEAGAFYPQLETALATETKVPHFAFRLLETVAGIAAAGGRQWQLAEQHFEEALRQAQEIPFKSEQAEARRFYADMLIDRDEPDDREKAKQLLEEAIAGYREIGMPRHIQLVEAQLERLAS